MYALGMLDAVGVIVDLRKYLALPGSSPILYLSAMEAKCKTDLKNISNMKN